MSAYFESLNRRLRVAPLPQQRDPSTRTTPPMRLRRLTPGDVPSGYAALAERLMVNANGKPLRTLVFAGCSGGEGSTSVALEFAESLAGAGMNVLLVDADMRTSGLTAGIAADGADLVEVVGKRQTPQATQWGRGKLTVVPSPKASHPDKDKFFRSKEFAAWLEAQQRLHDYLLLDAPPLLHFADGTLMARLSDGVVIVVRAEVTRRDALVKAREQLGKAGAHVIGVVMNRIKDPVPPFLRPYVPMG
jgi:capsular exopolysaccharide synthesis family protein